MKAFLKSVLIVIGCLSLDPVLAQPPKASSERASAADTIKQTEREWADAMIAQDLPRLAQIVADEWVEGYPGKGATKTSFLADIKSGQKKLLTCDFGPRDVQVFGDVAVLQGSVTETRMVDGHSTIFRVGYMDVWVKRGDRWMVIRSMAKKI